jgi:hypothetical protein
MPRVCVHPDRSFVSVLTAALLALGAACGGGAAETPPPAGPEATGPGAGAVAEPPSAAESEANESGATPTAEPAASAPGGDDDAPPAKDPNAQREVKYVMTPEGLKVEVEGARFMVNAEPRKIAAGWGVRVKVSAQALDDGPHTLTNPKGGPLAFAAAVSRGGGEAAQEGDQREGDGEITLKKGKVVEFHRDWPGKGGKILANGDALELQVGLWGIGENKDTRRPVKKFALVKMKVDKHGPRARVEPPPTQ